jgi:hypothetical protein
MITQPRIRNRIKRRSNRRREANPSSSLTHYTGPLTGPQEQLVTLDLVDDIAITSTAGGLISNVIGDVATGSPDWTDITSMYSEYRTLSMTVVFNPIVSGATVSTNAYNVLYLVWDPSTTTTPLASYNLAANYPVKVVKALNSPSRLAHKMTGISESEFIQTSSPVLHYDFKFYADTLTASTLYGRATVTFRTQFRGRN